MLLLFFRSFSTEEEEDGKEGGDEEEKKETGDGGEVEGDLKGKEGTTRRIGVEQEEGEEGERVLQQKAGEEGECSGVEREEGEGECGVGQGEDKGVEDSKKDGGETEIVGDGEEVQEREIISLTNLCEIQRKGVCTGEDKDEEDFSKCEVCAIEVCAECSRSLHHGQSSPPLTSEEGTKVLFPSSFFLLDNTLSL